MSEELYNIDKILDKFYDKRNKQMFYLVSWEGFGPEGNTWEPESSFEGVKHLIKQFRQEYISKRRRDAS